MERQNRLTIAGLFLVFLLIMGGLSVLNYRISKQISGTGRTQGPVSARLDPEPNRRIPGPKKKMNIPEGFDSDPLAPVVAKKPPLVRGPVREEPLKKVYEAVPRSGLLAN